MEAGKPVDMPCKGGINLYAAPITVDGETVGSITMGYGDPPKEDERLMEVAERYGVSLEKLRELSANMPSRPQFIVAVAKARLRSEAILLGEIIKRKRTEEALADLTKHLEERITEAYTATPGPGHRAESRRAAGAETAGCGAARSPAASPGAREDQDWTREAVCPAESCDDRLMRQVDDVLSDALRYTRTLVAELSPAVLRDHGLPAALKWLGEYMQKLSMRVTVNVPEQLELVLPEDQAVLLFQSVRELLINASKYAGTGEASCHSSNTVTSSYGYRCAIKARALTSTPPPLPRHRGHHPSLDFSASVSACRPWEDRSTFSRRPVAAPLPH